jgi:flagellar hook-basal body complex protein FliE
MQPPLPIGLAPPPVAGPVSFPPSMAPPEISFQEALWQALGQVQSLTADAQRSVEQSLIGDDLTMVESLTAVREADLALRLMIQIRNKLLEAYQEIQNLRM